MGTGEIYLCIIIMMSVVFAVVIDLLFINITVTHRVQHMGVAGLHDPILAAAGDGLVSFVFSCQVRTCQDFDMVMAMMMVLELEFVVPAMDDDMHGNNYDIRFRGKTSLQARGWVHLPHL